MIIERIRIQCRIHAALKGAKKFHPLPIESAQNALKQLQSAWDALQAFNAKHSLLRRILQWIDRKFCINPLSSEIKRLQKLTAVIIPPKPIPPPPPIKTIPRVETPIPPLEVQNPHFTELLEIDPKAIDGFAQWEEHFKNNPSDTEQFIPSALWYWGHEGKKSDKHELFKRLMYNEKAFVRSVDFLKMYQATAESDGAFIQVMPDLFNARLYHDADLTQRILECMERNLDPQAPNALQIKMADQLQELVAKLEAQNDPNLATFINEIRSIYRVNCIQAELPYIRSMFSSEQEDFIDIFDSFIQKHAAYIEQDPCLKEDLDKPAEDFVHLGIPFFIDRNRFIKEKRELVDQIGLAPIIYLKAPLEDLWNVVTELKNPDVTPEKVDEFFELIIAYQLFRVEQIRKNPAIWKCFDVILDDQWSKNLGNIQILQQFCLDHAIDAALNYRPHYFAEKDPRISFEAIKASFIKTHFEIAIETPEEDKLVENIQFLLQLNRFLKLKAEPLPPEQEDELVFEALPPILFHHIYKIEGVDQILLQFFERELPHIRSKGAINFYVNYLKNLNAAMSDHPAQNDFTRLLNQYLALQSQ